MQSNRLPLSTVTSLGTPKRHTIFCQKNFCRVAAVMSRRGLASIHFEKYSTATAAYLKLPGAVGSGPTISMPHRARGQTGGMRWTSSGGNFYSGHASGNLGKCARFHGRLPRPKASKTLHGKLFPQEPSFRCAKSTFLCEFPAVTACLRLARCIFSNGVQTPPRYNVSLSIE